MSRHRKAVGQLIKHGFSFSASETLTNKAVKAIDQNYPAEVDDIVEWVLRGVTHLDLPRDNRNLPPLIIHLSKRG